MELTERESLILGIALSDRLNYLAKLGLPKTDESVAEVLQLTQRTEFSWVGIPAVYR